MNWKRLIAGVAVGLALSVAGQAAPLNVLWYTGGVTSDIPGDAYQAAINSLATSAGWNVQFWSGAGGAAMPSGTFNVLVVASPDGPWTTSGGGLSPDYSGLTSALGGGLAFSSATDRIIMTGQDADFHMLSMNTPGPVQDGPLGFLQNDINWAGGGGTMGLVALGQSGVGLAGDPNFGFSGQYTAAAVTSATVANSIAFTGNAAVPASLSAGLTGAGLSNWNNSAHVDFTGLSANWVGVTTDGSGNFATIMSVSGGGSPNGGNNGGPNVPEPTSFGAMLGLAMAGFGVLRRREIC